MYLRDGVTTSAGVPKQAHISAASEIASGSLWERLERLSRQGHLLGATYKTKYRRLGPEGEAAAVPVGLDDATIVFPIVELRKTQVSRRG